MWWEKRKTSTEVHGGNAQSIFSLFCNADFLYYSLSFLEAIKKKDKGTNKEFFFVFSKYG